MGELSNDNLLLTEAAKPSQNTQSSSLFKNQKTMKIIVNGRSREFNAKKIDIPMLSILAFGNNVLFPNKNIALTVTYKTVDNKTGTLSGIKKIRITEGMIFNVTATDKS